MIYPGLYFSTPLITFFLFLILLCVTTLRSRNESMLCMIDRNYYPLSDKVVRHSSGVGRCKGSFSMMWQGNIGPGTRSQPQ